MPQNHQIQIREKFRSLLRPLDSTEFERLERSLIKHGCRDPIVLWPDPETKEIVLADGHNRLAICQKHGLPFETSRLIGMETEQQVLDWIFDNQLGKRNLTAEERAYVIGKMYNLAKVSHGGSRPKANPQNEGLNTAEKIGEKVKVSESTVERAGQFAEALDRIGEISPELKEQILCGESKLTKQEVQKLASASEQRLAVIVEAAAANKSHNLRLITSAKTDMHGTPAPFFKLVDAEFGFALDVCAMPENAKCARFYSPEVDGLKQSWADPSGPAWCNPPYGREIGPWIEKAFWTAIRGENTVVLLVPGRTHTKWWFNWVRLGEVRFIAGQLHYNDAEHGAPFNSALVIFRPEMAKPGYVPKTTYWDWEARTEKKAIALEAPEFRAEIEAGKILRIQNEAFRLDSENWVRVKIPASERLLGIA